MFKASFAILAAVTVATSAQAANLVTNGGFETSTYTSNTQFGAGFGGQDVAGWTGLDGDSDYAGTITQSIGGLTPGKACNLKFV